MFLPVEIHGGELPAARIASPRHGAHGRVEIVLATAHRLVAYILGLAGNKVLLSRVAGLADRWAC